MARDRRPQLRDLDAETSMGYARVGLTLTRCVATAALVLFLTPQSKAQPVDVSGRYQCAKAKVRGRVIGCKAAPLSLKNVGQFQLRAFRALAECFGSWSLWVPAAAAQHSAGDRPGQFSAFIFDLAIDDGVVDSLGELIGLREGGVVHNRRRVENGDVGEVAGLKETAALKMFTLGGKRSDFADSGFES